MTRVVLTVSGMHCRGCARRVHDLLEAQAELRDVRVDLASQTVAFDDEAPEAGIERIEDILIQRGYSVTQTAVVSAA
jgi:copper chaperone CopZ